MHIEVQVALNFVISYLYNKLPRRRVNIFGEELEKALKEKFEGHWYPDKPFKGSAFRCLKTGDPVDPVLQRAAREAGVPVHDVLDNLPQELAVWVDPGEVSYRIGEKGAVKLLLSESGAGAGGAGGEGSPAAGGSGGGSGGGPAAASAEDREVTRTFNPEAQCFRPVEAEPHAGSASPQPAPSPAGSPSPVAASFLTRPPPPPLTFTTATFAQTKFGSTKLKTSSKRANRMSPTEFSNYIKQRAMQQQQQQQLQSPRPLSPADYFLQGYQQAHGSHFPYHELYHAPPPPPPHHHQLFGGAGAGAGAGAAAASSPDGPPPPSAKQLLPPPPPPHHYQAHSPYQHLLVAN
ncbi:protein Tob1-like [Schistocerca gregaria]|uniref:protein Tob1-like n=1 Tax=Schistocerca gregaria TaxID=7010 RepID=UPI00211F15A7|nr:protein Tob1-like [Schistocerca gregaria]